MDFQTILTTLWSKVSKPLPNILIGAAFLVFAPDGVDWFGYIFLAIGISSIGEWGWQKIGEYKKASKQKKSIQSTLRALNQDEKALLRGMLDRGEQTYYINYNDYHGIRGRSSRSLGGRHEYVQLFGVCSGLKTKGLFVTASLEEITSWSLFPEVWEIMQEELSKDENFLRDTLPGGAEA
jgi:hypothetical protein